MFPERQPHPVKDLAVAIENWRRVCQPRGYCGPFLNTSFYDAFPDPVWHGVGECVHCRNTIHTRHESLKRRLAVRGFRNVRRAVMPRPAPPPLAVRLGEVAAHLGGES